MAQTLFSLLDLFASRFRSDSDNDDEQDQQNQNPQLTIEVADGEPQPRSRSHTETVRPSNLAVPNQNPHPNRSPNRSPVVPRQNRSMTTADPTNIKFLRPQVKPNNNNNNTTDNNNNNNTEIQINDTNNSLNTSEQPNVLITTSTKPLEQSLNQSGMTDGIEMQDLIDQESDDLPYATETPIEEEETEEQKKKNEEDDKKGVTQEPFDNKKFFIGLLKYFLLLIGLTLMVASVSTGYGLFEIYAGCRFTTEDFVYWPRWGVGMHALSRVFLNCLLCMFPWLLLFWFFGWKITKIPCLVSALCSAGASAWGALNAAKPMLTPTTALLPSYFFFVVALIFSSHWVGRKLKNHTFRHLFMGQFVLAAITLILYDFLIVPWYIEASSIQKSVVRILIHPGISALNLFVSRSCSSRIAPHIDNTQTFPVLIFMWFQTYYGRFFNSNMTLYMMTITMVIVSLLELLWRTTLKPRDKKIVNYICGYCFKTKLKHSNHFNEIYRDFLKLEQLYENVSIVTASMIYLAYYNVFDKAGLSYSHILSGMAIQYGLEWVTDAISMYIEEKYYKIDILHTPTPAKGFYFMIIYTFVLGMAYSTSRIILITYGTWLSDI